MFRVAALAVPAPNMSATAPAAIELRRNLEFCCIAGFPLFVPGPFLPGPNLSAARRADGRDESKSTDPSRGDLAGWSNGRRLVRGQFPPWAAPNVSGQGRSKRFNLQVLAGSPYTRAPKLSMKFRGVRTSPRGRLRVICDSPAGRDRVSSRRTSPLWGRGGRSQGPVGWDPEWEATVGAHSGKIGLRQSTEPDGD